MMFSKSVRKDSTESEAGEVSEHFRGGRSPVLRPSRAGSSMDISELVEDVEDVEVMDSFVENVGGEWMGRFL
jgi:hypothetical protein